jgi:hypothetical protein
MEAISEIRCHTQKNIIYILTAARTSDLKMYLFFNHPPLKDKLSLENRDLILQVLIRLFFFMKAAK